MLIANMDFAAGGGVLRDTRRLQKHFIDWRFGALGERVDCCAINVEGAGSKIGRKVTARLVELRVLGREVCIRLRRLRRRCDGARGSLTWRLYDDFGKLQRLLSLLRAHTHAECAHY